MGRIPSHPEPHYGLHLVRCPRCAQYAVRNFHVFRNRIRNIIRLDAAVRHAACAVIVMGLCMLFSTILAIELAHEGLAYEVSAAEWASGVFSPQRLDPNTAIGKWHQNIGSRLHILWLSTFIAIGAAWGGILPHWKRWALILTWCGMQVGILLAIRGGSAALEWICQSFPDPDNLKYRMDLVDYTPSKLAWGLELLLISMPLAVLGYPIGGAINRVLRGANRWTCRRYRRQTRRAQGKL